MSGGTQRHTGWTHASRRTGVLLVGYGRRGRQWHAHCARRHDLTVVGVVDPSPVSREAAAGRGVRAWPALEEALDRRHTDLAIVASPPSHHASQAIACLRAGIAVLVEKPLALSLAEAQQVAEAAKGRAPAFVAQNFRFLRAEQTVRRALSDGAIGRPLTVLVSSVRRPTELPVFEGRSALLWDYCIHHLDVLRNRFGAEPTSVRADVRTVDVVPRRRTTLTLELAWRDGLRALYHHSEGAPGSFYAEWIEGERRTLVVVNRRVALVLPSRLPRPVRALTRRDPEDALLQAVVRALRDGDDASPLSVRDNQRTIALVEAAERSLADGGRPVAPDDPGNATLAVRA